MDIFSFWHQTRKTLDMIFWNIQSKAVLPTLMKTIRLENRPWTSYFWDTTLRSTFKIVIHPYSSMMSYISKERQIESLRFSSWKMGSSVRLREWKQVMKLSFLRESSYSKNNPPSTQAKLKMLNYQLMTVRRSNLKKNCNLATKTWHCFTIKRRFGIVKERRVIMRCSKVSSSYLTLKSMLRQVFPCPSYPSKKMVTMRIKWKSGRISIQGFQRTSTTCMRTNGGANKGSKRRETSSISASTENSARRTSWRWSDWPS